MLNLKSKIIQYNSIITFVWWVLLLISFRIINNFHFQNGSSIIFLILFFIPPVIFKTISIRHRRRIKSQKAARKSGYYIQIKNDIDTNVFYANFLAPIKYQFGSLNLDVKESEINILINDTISLIFTEKKATISLLETNIKYSFYYSKDFEDLTKYDIRGVEFYPTEKLYQDIIISLNNLTGDLIYEEVYQGGKYLGCLLYRDNEVIYQIVDEPKKGLFAPKVKKTTKTIQIKKLKD